MGEVSGEREILELLSEHREELREFSVTSLGLFGSAVHGELDEESDLDVVVEFSEVTYRNYLGLKRFLEDLLEHEVDLIFRNSIKPRLRESILDETVYVEGFRAGEWGASAKGC